VIAMFYRVVPLSASFMLTSIVGFLVTVFFVYPYLNEKVGGSPWLNSLAFAIMLFFVLMFIASIISMTYSPLEADTDVLDRREKRKK
jgi:quinol-cytochrome oxidoreductase complex cytochrome b subunit